MTACAPAGRDPIFWHIGGRRFERAPGGASHDAILQDCADGRRLVLEGINGGTYQPLPLHLRMLVAAGLLRPVIGPDSDPAEIADIIDVRELIAARPADPVAFRAAFRWRRRRREPPAIEWRRHAAPGDICAVVVSRSL